MAKRLTPMDAMFLYGETPQTMMHVGGLLPFTMPPDAGADFLRGLMEEIRTETRVQPPWNQKLKTPGFLFNPLHTWVTDKQFDIEYHVRRSGLPAPGDERELGILVSRLHSNPLDLSRPPWEMHLIEGLEGDRFAFYIKMHHALVDGYSAMMLLSKTLSSDPDSRSEHLFFNHPPARRRPTEKAGSGPDFGALLARAGMVASSVPRLAKSMVNVQLRRDGVYKQLLSSYDAPHSVLNSRIGRNRRFATQQFGLDRFQRIARASGATVNDIVLAICGGGLRRFLGELGDLPEKSLVAFLPVNVRPAGDVGGGNAVGAILSTLGTDIADPVARLQAVGRSTTQAKKSLAGMPQETILAYSAMLLAPSATQVLSAMTGVKTPIPFTFNTCISNVPGPRDTLYFRGARLEATYPVSIPIHGMALNITCESYAGTLNFGFVGDRDALPHMQRLAVYTGAELDALEQALGFADGPAASAPRTGSRPPRKAMVRKAAAQKATSGEASGEPAAATQPTGRPPANRRQPRSRPVGRPRRTGGSHPPTGREAPANRRQPKTARKPATTRKPATRQTTGGEAPGEPEATARTTGQRAQGEPAAATRTARKQATARKPATTRKQATARKAATTKQATARKPAGPRTTPTPEA